MAEAFRGDLKSYSIIAERFNRILTPQVEFEKVYLEISTVIEEEGISRSVLPARPFTSTYIKDSGFPGLSGAAKAHALDRLFRVGEKLLAPSESVVHVVQAAFDKNPWCSWHSVNL